MAELTDGHQPATFDAGLVGRHGELEVISGLLDPGEPGGGGFVLHGAPGVGKSALLAEVQRRATDRHLLVIRTAGTRGEADMAFSGLEKLLQPLLGSYLQLPAPQRAALLGAVGVERGSAPDLFLIALAVLNLLTDRASGSRLVIAVDDAQWLDPGTSEVLAFVARRLRAEPVVMVVAITDGYESALLDAGLVDLTIDELDTHAAADLLDTCAPGLAPADRRRVLAEGGGNPLALIEFAAAAATGQFSFLGDSSSPELTERLESTFLARVRDLPAMTRSALLVAAADDGPVLAEVLSATSAYLGAAVSEEAVTPAIEARLLSVEDLLVRFRHPLVRSAIYQSATDEQRRLVHSALAETIAEPDRVAWHRASAALGPDDNVAQDLESVADRAESRGAVAAAVTGLERAAILTAEPERRVDRLLRAADLAVELGRADIVGRLLARVSDEPLTRKAKARAAWARDRFDDGVPGDSARALGLVADAKTCASDGDVRLALDLLLGAAWRSWWAPMDDSVTDRITATAESLGAEKDDPRLLAVLAVASPVKYCATVADRLADITVTADDDPTLACLRGLSAHTIGESQLAVQLLAGAATAMRAQGRLGLLARVLAMQAWSTIQLGSWSRIDTMASEAARMGAETGQPLWAAGAKAAESAAAGIRGDHDLADRLSCEVEAAALPSGLSNILCVLQIARGITALGRGAYDDAYRQLARVFDPADPAYHRAERHGALGYLVEAAVRTGHRERATEVVAECENLALQTPAIVLRLGLLYSRPLLSADADAEDAFLEALASDETRRPFFRARLQLAYGEWLRRKHRMADSRQSLRLARESFEALGAAPWAARAREQLRASGEATQPTEAAPPLARLTSQEVQVAELAATGLTNRQIGEQLFLSRRTVASHLYRLFPKLGITSRAELAVALARSRPTTSPET